MNFCKNFYKTLRADLPSDMHRKAWKEFEEKMWIRDRVIAILGVSFEVVNIIVGIDAATFKKEIMDNDSYDSAKADLLSFSKLKIFRDLSLLVLGLFTAMSFKWHRLS